MLFLPVSGALAVGILAGATIGINQQRYRDSLNSLQSLLQQQYSETTHVINDRTDANSCNVAGVTQGDSVAPESRGTSECVVVGRYITLTGGGKTITLSSVVGIRDLFTDPSNDLDALKQYNLTVSPINVQTDEVAWSASVVDETPSHSPQDIAILILRSPLTGGIRTFTSTLSGSTVPLRNLVINENTVEKKLCVDPSSFGVLTRLGVVIRANASSQAAIELLGDNSGC